MAAVGDGIIEPQEPSCRHDPARSVCGRTNKLIPPTKLDNDQVLPNSKSTKTQLLALPYNLFCFFSFNGWLPAAI